MRRFLNHQQTQGSLPTAQAGFTIIELLLAMTFFSFILLFFTFGFIQINRTFQRGATIKRVSETGRTVIEDIAREARLATGLSTTSSCFRLAGANVRYEWSVGSTGRRTLNGGGPEFSLIKSRSGNCGDNLVDVEAGNVTIGTETVFTQSLSSLLEDDIVVQNIEITPLDNAGQTVGMTIDMTLSTKDLAGDLLSIGGSGAQCNGFATPGAEFCDTVRFTTTVMFRNI